MASSGFDTISPLALRRLSFLALLGLASTAPAAVLPRADVPAPYVAAPFYPTPLGGWADESDPWAAAYAKAVELVGRMTLAEKTNITAGTGFFMGTPCVGNTGSADRVGFPQLCLQDGPLGVRSTDNITAFPAGITTGATFDKKLMYARGVALGQEFRGKGVNMYLGPSVGALGKKPRGGRNWEGFGADPVLQAFGGSETVRGVQEQGVIAVTKHLIGNEQEIQRMYNVVQQGISANIDDRTMHEIYLWPFAESVHAGTGAIMTSYNAVNGSAASQQSMLINGLLKNELGFQGLVMTDWLAQMSGVAGALAGTDMGMPGDTNVPIVLGTAYFMYELTRAALNGTVPMERVNDMATRVAAAWYKMGQDAPNYPRPNFSANTRDREGPLYPAALFSPRGVVNQYVNVQAGHAAVAKQVAQDAVTLLKNDGGLLPLRRDAPLKVFGTDAQANPDGINACADKNCNKGTLGMGWGSGAADYPYLDDPIGSLRRKAANVQYFATDKFPNNTPAPTADDVAVVFISSDSGENSYTVEGNHGDRDASGLAAWHGGDELVRQAAARYQNVVVVAHTVGPLIMEPWIGLPAVKAVLVAHLPGQEAGDSLTELLFGEASPSGHLPYTIPKSEDDYAPATRIVPNGLGQPQDTFSDGIYVDYRHFQARNVTPRYAFGHGLTYTTFNLSGVTRAAGVARSLVPPARPAPPTPAVAALNATIPAASEAYLPRGFGKIWRYLYSWLEVGEADRAYAVGAAGERTYAYPAGYSTEPKPLARAGGANGGNAALWDRAFTLRATVANAGATHAAKASVQLYVQFPASDRYPVPPLQLRDFAKTAVLAPGAAETVELRLTRKDLSVWDAELQDWVWPEGRFAFWLGDASDHFSAVCYSDAEACETSVPARGPL